MVLYTDVSDQCVGAVLTQHYPERDGPVPGIREEIPIYFLSQRLTKNPAEIAGDRERGVCYHVRPEETRLLFEQGDIYHEDRSPTTSISVGSEVDQ